MRRTDQSRAGLRALAVALVVLAARPTAVAASELTVRFFDVGQGDSALILSPAGKSVLIDAGPPEAAAALAQRLKGLLPGPVDLAILTHAHADHLGGMEAVLESVGLKLFMEPGFDHPSPLLAHLFAGLERRHVPLKVAEAGRNVDLGGGATLRLLAPGRPFIQGSRSDVNANSVVARVAYGRTVFYFAGDSELPTEQRLLASEEGLSANVYKVAHHGGRFSSDQQLLERIRPEVAVISVGAGNGYGHPSREVIDRLEQLGATVWRTDLDGEITVRTDGSHLTVIPGRQAERAPASPARSVAAPAAGFAASRSSDVFHRADCPAVATIRPRNALHFATRAEAVAAGRHPAKDCHP